MSGDNEDRDAILDAEVSKMMDGVERREKTKQDVLAKMLTLAELDKHIIRVSLHVRGRHRSPSQLIFMYVGHGGTCGPAEEAAGIEGES